MINKSQRRGLYVEDDNTRAFKLLEKVVEINNENKEFVWLQVPLSRPEILQFLNPNTGSNYSIAIPKYVKAGEYVMVSINAK